MALGDDNTIMSFSIFNFENTHSFHRKALLNAVEKVNSTLPPHKDIVIIVSTKNMIKCLPMMLFRKRSCVVNLIGLGRLYSDYGWIGRLIFNCFIWLYSAWPALAFIVEHETDRRIIQKLTPIPVYKTHGSGLDASGFHIAKIPRAGRIRLGYLSRFHPSKGSEEILESIKTLPDSHEIIIAGWDIGGANFEDAYRQVASTKDNVTFLGRLDGRSAVSDFFNNIDCFLCPTVREGGCIALQEAIWHRVPFLTTSVPGCDILAERFQCPAVALNDYPDAIQTKTASMIDQDTSDWHDLLTPFMSPSVEQELVTILFEIAHNSRR